MAQIQDACSNATGYGEKLVLGQKGLRKLTSRVEERLFKNKIKPIINKIKSRKKIIGMKLEQSNIDCQDIKQLNKYSNLKFHKVYKKRLPKMTQMR